MALCLAWGPAASAQASSEPIIESESASHITSEDATLNATINTQGLYTAYEFQIDTVPNYNFSRPACPLELPGYPVCEALITGEPLPAGLKEPQPVSIPAGLPTQSVSVDLASIGAILQPGTTYHFRVIAANTSDGITVYGPDQTFTTPGGGPAAGTAPSIDEESVSKLSPTDATLEAQVNPHEASAGVYYQFQLATDTSEYAPEILCPSKLPPTTDGCNGTQSAHALLIGFIAGDTLQPGVDRPASLDLASAGVTLKPRTTYHYRLLVARRVQTEDTIQWEAPTIYGPDQTFTTPPVPMAPVIDSVSITHLTPSDATLEARIDTEGLPTTYEFLMWYTRCIPCEDVLYTISLPSGLLLGSFVDQSVSLDLGSAGVTLRPGAYGYSVIATSKAGSTEAHWQTFEPPSGSLDQPSLGVSSMSGGIQTIVPTSGQSAGSATTAIPALQGSSSPGASSKTSAAKPAVKHKHRHPKAARHRAGTTKHKRHKT